MHTYTHKHVHTSRSISVICTLSDSNKNAYASDSDALLETFTMYYLERDLLKQKHYTECYQEIASFNTVEQFWSIYSYLSRIDELNNFEFMIFRANVPPVWEHNRNRNGGRWILKIDKPLASKVWECCLLAFIGGVLQCKESKDEINGLVISTQSKLQYVSMSIWNKDKQQYDTNQLQQKLAHILDIDVKQIDKLFRMEYRAHSKGKPK